ncbi:hypothetical protein [Variovorax sp. R-27]|uniref:hypothetical protein n=1 Tax=Variovorax sp. R-27 TaxID=3404058 RepID=UPI003CE739F8
MNAIDIAYTSTPAKLTARPNRHRQLIDSIDNVAQTVEESSAFAQGKKLVERHPFLTGLLGPSIVRKLFGR